MSARRLTVVLSVAAATAFCSGCGDDSAGTGGGGNDASSTSTEATGGGGFPSIGTARLLVVNYSDREFVLGDVSQENPGRTWVASPRMGFWIDAPVFGANCRGLDSCIQFRIMDGIVDETRHIDAKVDDELALQLGDHTEGFPTSVVEAPGPGNASVHYRGQPKFGIEEAGTFTKLVEVTEVPADSVVGHQDRDGNFSPLAEDQTPLADGGRYLLFAAEDPLALLVCNADPNASTAVCPSYAVE